MIALLDNGQDLDQCAAELGCDVGQLLTALTRYTLRDPTKPWAIDNGGYKTLDIPALLALLKREEHHKEACLFVAVPDIVGSARRTIEVFEHWKPRLQGWKLALVCQDGQEHLPIPWNDIDAVFIGGTTAWKCGPHAEHIIRAAKALGKHVHAGRVNSPERFSHFEKLGADTCDGTGIGRYSHMREAVAGRDNQRTLLDAV
ncbi:MAG TPA: hypothetical protein VGN60_07775 [Devosia sp.]|jgi:hypothetical protein|nr:hypothetical protein [Devosia sp.]